MALMRRSTPSNKCPIPDVSFRQCYAKTYLAEEGVVRPGRTVVEHCQIVGEVAKELVARYPESLRAALFPQNAPFAAACHDIGKVSPFFFEKLRRNFTVDADELQHIPVDPSIERNWGGHAGVSEAAARALGAPKWIPEVLGQHHGFSPSLNGKLATDEVFGGISWQNERKALVQELMKRLAMDWPSPASPTAARLLAGLTSVADWIGSGQHFENPELPWQHRIAQAVTEAGFTPPTFRNGLQFTDIFPFHPNRTQEIFFGAISGPGVYVLEAPMGLGKTEAALYAAYRLLSAGHATGIYFALPTQLTSNKIYERFNEFLSHILTEDCEHRSLLLHANAWLIETEMGEEGRPGGAWFNQSKRGLLAPFAVGTIDQALMAAMNVKHGFVRAYGLAGKVVILDEVHSYDAYTGTLLDALLAILRQLQCTVIILSATLSRARRNLLLSGNFNSTDYPLITAVPTSTPEREIAVPLNSNTTIDLHCASNDKSAIEEALWRAGAGQQVLWIENTVNEAQQRYLDLASRANELGVECGLLHSRFTMSDRQSIEQRWVHLYGKHGHTERRRHGRILVGTQILEQSLDIDADFLITRFAPTDMVLQRLGRLWRHKNTPRPPGTICEAWLLVPDLTDAIKDPKAEFGASAFVYSPYVLCRSLEVWISTKSLSLPGDIRSLIDATYAERTEEGAMSVWLHELDHGTRHQKGRLALQQLARIGLSENGITLPESKAQTRYSESENAEVLLVRSIRPDAETSATHLVLLDGRTIHIPWHRNSLTKREWKELTTVLSQEIVPVRIQDATDPSSRATLESYGFHHCFYLGDRLWQDDESLFRLGVVAEDCQVSAFSSAASRNSAAIVYRQDLGYRTRK